jgi:hypothetical protein
VLGINNAEYTSLIVEDVEELDEDLKTRIHRSRRVVAATAGDANAHDNQTAQWINKVRCDTEDLPESPTSDHTLVGHRFSRSFQYSDAALPDQAAHAKSISLSRRLRQFLFGTLERFLVFAGFAQLMHGIVIYTGGCREHYLNGCLAHIISEFIIIFPLFSASMIHPNPVAQRAGFSGVTVSLLLPVSLGHSPSSAGPGTVLPASMSPRNSSNPL